MTTKLNIVPFPFPPSGIKELPSGLRAIADGIEQGLYGDAHNLAWVIDGGDGDITIGMLGASASAGSDAHLLFALAQRKIEAGII